MLAVAVGFVIVGDTKVVVGSQAFPNASLEDPETESAAIAKLATLKSRSSGRTPDAWEASDRKEFQRLTTKLTSKRKTSFRLVDGIPRTRNANTLNALAQARASFPERLTDAATQDLWAKRKAEIVQAGGK